MIKSGVPLGRIGKPSDIAGTCLFLASEAGEYVNGGISIPLDANSSHHRFGWRICLEFKFETLVIHGYIGNDICATKTFYSVKTYEINL